MHRDLSIIQGQDYIRLGTDVSGVIKSSPGSVLAIACTNLNTANRYIQFFDSASAPTGGATPQSSYPVYNTDGLVYFDERYFGYYGRSFNTGIAFGFSTTPLTYTAGTASDLIIEVRYY